jgi:hypothetical protein
VVGLAKAVRAPWAAVQQAAALVSAAGLARVAKGAWVAVRRVTAALAWGALVAASVQQA